MKKMRKIEKRVFSPVVDDVISGAAATVPGELPRFAG